MKGTITNGTITIFSPKYDIAEVQCSSQKNTIEGFDHIGKVFTGDQVQIDNQKCTLIKSNIKSATILGMLQLYSKYKYAPNKRGVERFKCVPISKKYPEFLVATRIRRKYTQNILVTIRFLEWTDKLPYAELVHPIGYPTINNLYEGVLHKFNLKKSRIKLPKNTYESLHINSTGSHTDRRDLDVFSIDPESTLDIDDALSLEVKDNVYKIGIHISDVIGTLEEFNLLYLLDNLSTTIYAPHKILNMLPEQLSENLLSLRKGKERYVITLWLVVKDNCIQSTDIEKNLIINRHRLTYDNCQSYKNYTKLYDLVKKIKYRDLLFTEFDSHTLIEKLMIIYNCEITRYLIQNRLNPILRKHEVNLESGTYLKNKDMTLPTKLQNFIKIINNKAAIYTYDIDSYHYGLGLKNYGHCTSPIRRYVDCYNQYLVHQLLSKNMKDNNNRLNIDIDFINSEAKMIKKAERMFNKLRLSDTISNGSVHLFKGYIYSSRNNKIEIYFPDQNITISKLLIDPKLNECLVVENNIIIHYRNEIIIKEYRMFELLDVEIYVVVNKSNPYNKFIITLQ